MRPFVVTDSKLYSSRILSKHPSSSGEGVQVTLRTQPCFSLSSVMFTACAVQKEAQLAIIFLNTAIASCLFKVYHARGNSLLYAHKFKLFPNPFFLKLEVAEQFPRCQMGLFYKKTRLLNGTCFSGYKSF
jgi:hypothetical protein